MSRLAPALALSVLAPPLLVTSMTLAGPEAVPFDSQRWRWEAPEHAIEEHLGRPSVRLKGGVGWVADAPVEHGVVEFDISFTGERGFVGGLWRLQDAANYEEFYLRPHQSGQPDATQYTPVFHGAAGWQLYHGAGYSAPVEFPFDTWIPVRIVFDGDRAEVFIGDMATPAVAIHELKHGVASGAVGIMAGNFAPAWFSRFRFERFAPSDAASATRPPLLKSAPVAPARAEAGTVMSWRVSSTFDEASQANRNRLSAADIAGLSWTELEAESTGITNLARVQGIEQDRNTVFASTTLPSRGEREVRLRFGYSDRVRVYLDGRLLYAGDNTYRSRDFRYLGTIGLFDELVLPLRDGDNDLWIAVSESFGGWGLLAVVE